MNKEMNEKLMLEIFRIPSLSYKEDAMRKYIENFLVDNKIEYLKDFTGNLYNVSYKDEPMLCAHMDTVQDDDDASLAHFIDIKGHYISGYGIIGGDDKCGIYIILKALLEKKNLNFLFTVEEEVGDGGSSDFVRVKENQDRLRDVLYCLVLDRKGNSDILCQQNNYGTNEFEVYLEEVGKLYGYSPAMGTFCDADKIRDYTSCANLSVGYYNPHTKKEYVDTRDLEISYKFVMACLTKITVKFEPSEAKHYDAYGSYRNYGGYGGYDDDYEDEYSEYDSYYKDKKYCPVCGATCSTKYFSKKLNKYFCKDCLSVLLEELLELETEVLRSDSLNLKHEEDDIDVDFEIDALELELKSK